MCSHRWCKWCLLFELFYLLPSRLIDTKTMVRFILFNHFTSLEWTSIKMNLIPAGNGRWLFFYIKKSNLDWTVTLEHKGKMNISKKSMIRRKRKHGENRIVRYPCTFINLLFSYSFFFLPQKKQITVDFTDLCKIYFYWVCAVHTKMNKTLCDIIKECNPYVSVIYR